MVYVLWGLWVIFCWGVLFFCLCTTTCVCISCNPCSIYSYVFFYFSLHLIFILYLVCLLPGTHFPQVLLFPNYLNFNHDWMKTFGGCMHMCFIICSYMCILKYVYLGLLYICIIYLLYMMSLARIVRLSM